MNPFAYGSGSGVNEDKFFQQLSSVGHGVAAVKSDRFTATKDITPGPGQYDLDKPKAVKPRPSLLTRHASFKPTLKNSSRASSSSSSSIYVDVDDTISFKTPSKKSMPSSVVAELQHKYDQVMFLSQPCS